MGLLASFVPTFETAEPAAAATPATATPATSAATTSKTLGNIVKPRLAPGNPGVPSDPTVLVEEDFENVPGTAPVLLDEYTSADERTYTADELWLTGCNGQIVNFDISYTTIGNCATEVNAANLRQLVYALGVHVGAATPAANDAVAAYTDNNPGTDAIEFQTVEPIPLATASGRFLTFSVDASAMNCQVSAPIYQFSFLPEDGVATPVGGQVNACTSGQTVAVPASGPLAAQDISVGTYTSNGSLLFEGSSLGIRMVNANGSGIGNDAAFDNIRVLDVTPQLDKSFSPSTVFVDGAAALTFTVTNTSELAAKNGWSFTDNLPDGLTIASSPNVSTTCPSGVVTANAGETSIDVTGNLTAEMASCAVTVDVTATTAGTYTNGPDNVTESGLNPPGETTVEFIDQAVVSCATDNALFNTAYDALTGNVLPGGSRDQRWDVGVGTDAGPESVTTWQDAFVPVTRNPLWTAVPLAGADWVTYSPTTTHEGPIDAYFRFEFDIDSAVLLDGFELPMDFYADNSVPEVWVNGIAQSATQDSLPQAGANNAYRWNGFSAGTQASTSLTGFEHGENEMIVRVASDAPEVGFMATVRPTDLCVDFGDEPESYGTSLASDGARHAVPDYDPDANTASVMLGSSIDIETDGQPNADATGDDASDIADEDGVVSPIVVTVGDATTVTVSATNTTAEAVTIAGWIDLDGSGTFDAGELVTATVPENSGTADYGLTFPTGTVTDDTFARFRLFPASVTEFLPTGASPAGEVEDYAVTVIDRDLDIEKTSDMTADSRPGDDITYTVTATNTGTADYTDVSPAVLFDDLAGVLDDATYNNDATAEASDDSDVTDPAFIPDSFLSWTGALAAGESVTVTYTVTLTGGGDGTARNVAWQPTTPPSPGEPPTAIPACDPPTAEGTDPVTGAQCAVTEGLLPKLSVQKTSDVTDLAADGDVVTYTVTVTNAGPGVFSEAVPATMTDDLSKVLDDGAFGEITAPADGAARDGNELSWSGPLGVGESIDITYTVVYDAEAVGGDHVLLNGACVPVDDALDPAAACDFVLIPAAVLVMDKTVDPADGTTVVAGQEVTYTLTFENTGEAGATVDALDDLSDVLDDAALTEGPTADDGLTATLNGDQLSITGEVPVGETLTVTYTVTVNAYANQADHVLGNVLSYADGSCPPTGCVETENPIRHITVEKSADPTTDVQTGDTVEYTVTVTNDGEAAYTAETPVVITDDMTGVLDDATYNGDAAAAASDDSVVPAPQFASPALSWSGPLAAGESVTITYTVTVTNLGDHDLLNAAGAVCADPEICDPSVEVEVPLPYITPSKTSDPASGAGVNAGDVVTYTLSFTNDGLAAGPVDSTDDLSDVLDDGTITSDPVASVEGITAELDLEAETIRVTGDLAPGETVSVTYEVTIGAGGDRGNNIAGNVLTPDVPPFVPPGDCDPADCPPFVPPTTEHPIGELAMDKTVDPASGEAVEAGQQVTYTLSFENTGEAPVSVNTVDDLSGVLDDATLVDGSIVASDPAITATLNGDQLAVSGEIPAGVTFTVTYAVTVNAYTEQADHVLANALQCAEGAPEECEPETTTNPIRHFTVEKSATPLEGVQADDTVEYTVTVTNDGAGDYTDEILAAVTDDMTDVLDDATYNGDAEATASDDSDVPAPGFVAPTLTWSGALDAGESVTITYSVTVTNLGDHDLVNLATPVCAEGVICDPPTPPVEVLLPSITPLKASDPVTGEDVNAGDVVTYTLSWTNDGQVTGPLDSTDDLSDVLDDATLTSEPVVDAAHADTVSAVFDDDAQTIRVTGGLAPGETVTVTYQVTILPDGERGNNIAGNILTPDVPPFVPNPDCETDCVPPFEPPTTEHPIGELDDWKSVDPASGSTVQPGNEVTYTLHFENTGEAPVDVARDDVLTQVVDDATITVAPVSSDAALSVSDITDGRFTVTGSLQPGQAVTVSYTVAVNADGARGDDRLGNFLVNPGEEPPAECVSTDDGRADCTVNHVSNVVASKSSDPASGADVAQGGQVTYTLTFENVSTNPDAEDTAIDYTDHMVDVLDDATLTNGPTVSDAAVTAAADGDTIRVAGAIASGDTVTVTYTVTVKAYDQQGNHHLGNVVAVTGEAPVCASGSDLCTSHGLTPPPPPLAETGSDIAFGGIIGALGLLILGGGALLMARRRSSLGKADELVS